MTGDRGVDTAIEAVGIPATFELCQQIIALTVCTACGAGQQQAGGELVPIGDAIVAMAHCDGQHIRHVTPLAANENGLPAHQHLDGGPATASVRPKDARPRTAGQAEADRSLH
jgi:hypothetical protein